MSAHYKYSWPLPVCLFYMYVSPLQVFLTFACMPLLHVCQPTTSIPDFYMFTSSTCMSAHYKYSWPLSVCLFYMYVCPLQVFLTFVCMPLLHVCQPTTSIPDLCMDASSTCMSAHYKYSWPLHGCLFYMYVCPLQVFLTFAWMPLLVEEAYRQRSGILVVGRHTCRRGIQTKVRNTWSGQTYM
jgi:hypothetical protein